MRSRQVENLILAAAVVIYCAGAVRLVSLPEQEFASNVIIDDALYFLVPAQHLLAGEGFSFDGIYLTNGVQTLWALVTIGVAALVPDTLLAMRSMSLLSGLCWLAAGLMLYAGLRDRHRGIALFVTCGWLMSAFTQRVAFQGMENGLHGLLFAMILVATMRLRRREMPYLGMGILVGFFALARTESALLAALVCIGIFLGFLHPDGRRKGLHWGPALRFGLPVLFLVGGAMLCSAIWFDSLTPVSGRVKMFYESSWGRETVHGPPLENLAWHVKYLRGLILAPLSDNAAQALDWLGVEVRGSRLRKLLLGMYGLGLIALVLRSWRRRRARAGRFGQSVARDLTGRMLLILAVFLIAHVALMGLLLPHFTGYGTWYFAAEFAGLWLLVGCALYALLQAAAKLRPQWLRPALRTARLLAPCMVLLASLPQLFATPLNDPRTNHFIKAGRWLNETLPPGQRIGSLSAGLVGAYANRHTVYNLDGLISSREYCDEFLMQDRVPEFFAREKIRYFADYAKLTGWRLGISWCGNIPLQRLRLNRWWRLDDETAYAIWEVLPVGQSHEVLSNAPATADALAELRFAAEVLDRFEVIREQDLAPALADRDGMVLLTSMVLEPSGDLRHVLVSHEQLQTIRLPPAQVTPDHPLDLRIGASGLSLYGCDLTLSRLRPGGQLLVSRFWRATTGDAAQQPVVMTLTGTAGGEPVFSIRGPICHGTLPGHWLAEGNAVVDTLSIAIPDATPPGSYSLRIDGTVVASGIQVIANPGK